MVIVSLLFLNVFVIYGKRVAPYFIAAVQHLLGDYLVGGSVQLLWPVSVRWYGVGIEMTSVINILMEWTFFLTSLGIMLRTKDVWTLFQPHQSNLLLSIPAFTVLLPELFRFPLSVPLELMIPHLTYLAIFTFSVLVDLKSSLGTTNKNRSNSPGLAISKYRPAILSSQEGDLKIGQRIGKRDFLFNPCHRPSCR